MQLPPGTLLKQQRYQIETTLGQGGFGITYRGIDRLRTLRVAIKENWPDSAIRQGTTVVWMRANEEKKQEQLQQFKTEAKYLSKCIHPNIVRVYDWFEENDTAYTVMSFVQGKSLLGLFQEIGKFPVDRLLRYFLQVAAALQVIHSKKLLHRDIKPENILIDSRDRAILIDFGAMREYQARKTGKMTAILTPAYAPIEQYSTFGQHDTTIDIYALCASMYHLLTGYSPAEAPDRISSDRLIPPSQLMEIDSRLEQIILIGMARDRQQRFQSAGKLMECLNALYQTGTARLVYLHPGFDAFEFEVKGDRAIVGRSDPETGAVDIDLNHFRDRDTISRRHGELYKEGNHWKVRDLDSTNHIYIKRSNQSRFGPKITTPEFVNSGDEISFGKICFLFQIF
ncbi:MULTISPECIES: FHA domain-containing serine/threonine-protein kinase [Spirulina sp. CCY15215]|uniref:FHA domain-containing serine/threonine-protein kinase n=1 Tax=Spirulina sp. CCY15215 TaxID=2767591 RepID=UPI00195101F8|nr:FHA domain-containing serine/threonine-protein kinase [Spirulina major]